MANQFANTSYTPDILFEGDQILEVENPHTRLFRRSVDPRSGRPGPSRPERYPAYQFREFPKMKYHVKLGAAIVNDAAEEADLGAGWQEKPFEKPREKKSVIFLP
jgi:hypothetical protein